MTVLSALTDDELLARLPNGWQWRIPLCDELRRRLSAGEKAEKTARVIAAMLCDIPPDDADRLTDPIVAGVWHLKQQAEARVAELERELVTANKRALDDVLAVLDRALSAGSETSDKPWPIGDQPSCPIAGPCDGECGLCKPSAGSET